MVVTGFFVLWLCTADSHYFPQIVLLSSSQIHLFSCRCLYSELLNHHFLFMINCHDIAFILLAHHDRCSRLHPNPTRPLFISCWFMLNVFSFPGLSKWDKNSVYSFSQSMSSNRSHTFLSLGFHLVCLKWALEPPCPVYGRLHLPTVVYHNPNCIYGKCTWCYQWKCVSLKVCLINIIWESNLETTQNSLKHLPWVTDDRVVRAASQWHEMFCHLEAMSLNPSWVEIGVRSTGVLACVVCSPKSYLNQKYNIILKIQYLFYHGMWDFILFVYFFRFQNDTIM